MRQFINQYLLFSGLFTFLIMNVRVESSTRHIPGSRLALAAMSDVPPLTDNVPEPKIKSIAVPSTQALPSGPASQSAAVEDKGPLTIEIIAPKTVRIGHAVTIEIRANGALREKDLKNCIKVTPEPLATDWHPDPDGDPCKVSFSGEAGDYVITGTIIGKDEGWAQAQVLVSIIDPNAQAKQDATNSAPTPEQLLKASVDGVSSPNKKTELLEIVSAGRKTLLEISRPGGKEASRAIVEWAAQSYVQLPNSFRPWNSSTNGKPFFFETVDKMFKEFTKKPENSPVVFLESVLDILEKIANGLPG